MLRVVWSRCGRCQFNRVVVSHTVAVTTCPQHAGAHCGCYCHICCRRPPPNVTANDMALIDPRREARRHAAQETRLYAVLSPDLIPARCDGWQGIRLARQDRLWCARWRSRAARICSLAQARVRVLSTPGCASAAHALISSRIA